VNTTAAYLHQFIPTNFTDMLAISASAGDLFANSTGGVLEQLVPAAGDYMCWSTLLGGGGGVGVTWLPVGSEPTEA
jgi:hypothetical protein